MSSEPFAISVLLVGAVLVLDLLLQASLRRTAVPATVVHLGLGLGLALTDWRWSWLGEAGNGVIDFLGSVGIVLLLFRVGLESNIRKLASNLRRASLIWIADITVSGSMGFALAYYGLDFDLVPSLFCSAAMTATSVGVGVAVWQEENALDSNQGQLFLDVAELDDISGIVLMAVLFAVAPLLRDGLTETLVPTIAWTVAWTSASLVLFGLAVAALGRFAEAPFTRLLGRIEPAPDRLITVVSLGLIVAAAAGALGFSLAVGAFFGGLAFSRDPEAVRLDVYFDPLYDFFTPFFFISIGMSVDPETFGAAFPLGLALFAVAAGGKFLGVTCSSLLTLRPASATLLGLSMIPRAEIAMVIVQHGVLLGGWAVSPELFSAMVLVSLLSCITAPIGVRALLQRAPSDQSALRRP